MPVTMQHVEEKRAIRAQRKAETGSTLLADPYAQKPKEVAQQKYMAPGYTAPTAQPQQQGIQQAAQRRTVSPMPGLQQQAQPMQRRTPAKFDWSGYNVRNDDPSESAQQMRLAKMRGVDMGEVSHLNSMQVQEGLKGLYTPDQANNPYQGMTQANIDNGSSTGNTLRGGPPTQVYGAPVGSSQRGLGTVTEMAGQGRSNSQMDELYRMVTQAQQRDTDSGFDGSFVPGQSSIQSLLDQLRAAGII